MNLLVIIDRPRLSAEHEVLAIGPLNQNMWTLVTIIVKKVSQIIA